MAVHRCPSCTSSPINVTLCTILVWSAAGVMTDTRRLNTTIDRRIFDRLQRETEGRTPQLPRRYVVELALQRLFQAIDKGQLELGLGGDGRQKK